MIKLTLSSGKVRGLHERAGIHIQRLLKHSSTLLNIHETFHFTSSHFIMLERFTVILYHKVSALLAMKLAGSYSARRINHWRIFLPLMQDALLQHARGAVFQANIWTTSLQNIQDIPTWGSRIIDLDDTS